ncbi:MAG: hypothetical protein LBH44_10280 [Treponema sp.]|jgi:hypothetical protein|nr:hypothetical protein [Treponema sp.]
MKTIKLTFCVVALLMAAVFAGCKSLPFEERENPDLKLAGSEYTEALEIIEFRKPEYEKDKNHISFLLDTGLLHHYAGEYRKSTEELKEAGRLIDEAFTKSISEGFSAILSGSLKKQQYPGEDHENIYLQVFNSLNYYHLGNYESAMVEIRQMNEKLKYMEGEYQAQADKLKKKQTPRELNFTNSALARFLGVLYHRGSGNLDGARIDAQELANAFTEFPNVYTFPIPQALVLRNGVCEETSIPEGKARLNILSFTGLSEIKVPVNDNFQFWYDNSQMIEDKSGRAYYRNAHVEGIPPFSPLHVALDSRSSSVDRIAVAVEGGAPFTLSPIEDLEAVIKTLKDRVLQRMAEIEGRKLILDVLSGGYTVFLDPSVRWYGYFSNMPLKTWLMDFESEEYKELWKKHIKGGLQAESREILDTRMGRFFPGRAHCGGINLDPGSYTVTINYYAGNTLLGTDRRENVQVQAGKLNLIESMCFKGIELPEFEKSF